MTPPAKAQVVMLINTAPFLRTTVHTATTCDRDHPKSIYPPVCRLSAPVAPDARLCDTSIASLRDASKV